MDEILGIAEGL
jgi:hypothetical protein